MKKFFTKSLLLILLAFGGINAAFANYSDADSYNGYFQYQRVKLTLDDFWISWRFPNYDYDGTDDALKYSRWYVGGNAASLTTYNTNPSHYFFYPLDQGTEILYMDRTYRIGQRQNGSHGGGEVYNEKRSGDIRTHDVKFYPGEQMGPAQMAAFFVRWTGWWDTDDNGSKGTKDYWMGQVKAGIGDPTDGAYWQGSGVRHKGNGIARYTKITYEIPETNAATFTRKPDGKIEVSIAGNDHGSWDEYYGFGNGNAVDSYGYYTNAYGISGKLSSGKGTYTLDGTFDETENQTIYYHQLYKRTMTIKGQGAGWEDAGEKPIDITQHAQASRLSAVIKGYIYPSNLQVTQNKWDKTVKLTWTVNNKDNDHDTDGGWLVFRQKVGEQGYTLVTPSRLNNSNNSYTDTDIDTGAEYTYWVTFAPTVYGNITAPISSKLSCSTTAKHDNTFSFTDVNAELNGEQGGVLLTWTPERENSDVSFFVQRWNEESQVWENLNNSALTTPRYVDENVETWEEYKYRIKTSYWGIDFYSEEKNICYTIMTKVDELKASQGSYSNMVKLNWNVTVLSEGDTRYVVSRKLLGDPQAVFTKIYEMLGSENTFYYEDASALPGQFYDYKVTAFAYNKEAGKWVEGNSKEADGFVQTRGIITGRIKYGTGTAVQGAKVILVKSDDNDNTSKQFYSLHLDGDNADGIEWTPSEEIIENFFTGDNRPWSIQMYVRPEAGMSGTQAIFDVNGYAGVAAAPAGENYELYVKSATGGGSATVSATGITIPTDKYSHIVFSYDGAETYTLRTILPETDNVEFIEGKQMKTFTGKDNVQLDNENRTRTIKLGASGFKGYIDEVRVWTKVLTDNEIVNYYDRTLTCNEPKLLCYWPMDEGINGLHNIYDYSKTNGVPNGNHAVLTGGALISEVVPATEQLSLYGITDENGNYVIRGVPFSGDGTTYIVRPVMGIHEFNPSYHTRYVSSNSLTHDDITFEDVSSFPVSGVVYYENTTFPVQGCNLYIDGNACSKEGELIETDEFGRFEISVPIGDHHITVEKNGHTFVSGGRYPSGIDTKFTFDKPVSNLTFYDNTLVNIAGRVVGGDIEGNQKLGFALSKNNIGVAQLVLTPTNDIYSLNAVKKVNGTVISYENNSEQLPAASATGKINSTSWRGSGDNAGRIYINTDATTGEFSAMVPPLVYNISAPIVLATNETVGNTGLIDVSNPLVTESDTLVNENGAEQIFEYCAKYNSIYHSAPDFTVVQNGLDNGKFGITHIDLTDEAGDFTVELIKDGEYVYDKPFFIQGDPYTFKLKGFELYTNYDNGDEVTTTVPLKDCIVTISNALSDGQPVLMELEEGSEEDIQVGDVVDLAQNQLQLDENGEGTYRWWAGYANITAPYSRTISMTYEVGGQVNTWKIDGNDFIEGVILGSLPTGCNFVTQGPDKLLMVLRDPPGSGSYAEWTSGSTVVKDSITGHCWSSETTLTATACFGGDVTIVTGVGVATEIKTSTSNDLSFGTKVVTEGENSRTVTHTLTTSETFATSEDPSLVGSLGDVFIGNSTNLLFGKARQVGFARDTNKDVSLGVKEIITVGSTFGTKFVYTQYYIESYLLPNLEALRNSKLISLSEADYNSYRNTSDELKFITKLTPEDERFGSNNSDKDVWGDEASEYIEGNKITDASGTIVAFEGPSYKLVLPDRLTKEKKEYSSLDEISADQDSIYYYNLQISNWTKHLEANEREKIKAWEDSSNKLLRNYSFDGGTSINYTYETDTTIVDSREHNSGAIAIVGLVSGFEVNGFGWETEASTETGGTRHSVRSDSKSETASLSFNFVESGDDALSVDVYKSAYGYIFRTRAGQTSAPYEDEEYTRYYQPGKHKLHEATMQIEVPDIEVEVATIGNLASGSAANYNLLLTNKSEIDCDLYYKLLMMDETNPNGAQLSIDGVALSDNRVIKVPAGEVVRKTLQLKQSNLGILDYENIGIVLSSIEQGDPTGTYPQIADTVYISAHYVPSSSPVKMELDRTLLNTSTGANLNITFNSFDRNYYNLKAFRVQYMKQGDTDWTTLKEYLVNVKEGQQLSSMQAVLPEAADVTFTYDMSSEADGKYTFRVLSASTYGTGESTLVTDAIEVIKDMSRPMVFGTPKPTNGFLGNGDDIEITFNEDINSGRLTQTGNFIVTAALNGATVAHDIAILATGTKGAVAKTEANFNLIGKSFAVDMWVRVSGEGTIFSHGNGTNKIALGVKKIDGQYYFTVNGKEHGNPLPADKWIYIAFNLEQDNAEGSCFSAIYASDDITEVLATAVAIERYEGNGVVALGDGFTGAIHEVALWDEAIDVTTLQAQMYDTKMPTTEHLIGYWKFNEGNGTQAKDVARNRHMNLSSTSWYLNNKNMSLNLVDAIYGEDDAIVLNTSECVARTGDDYMIEMWFRADKNQNNEVAYLFDSDFLSVVLENGKMKLYSITAEETKQILSMGTKSYTDSKWHHIAINVLRNGNTVVYIDGESVGQAASTNVPAMQSAYLYLGAKRNRDENYSKFDVMSNKLVGEIDEIRIWNATVNASVIRDRMNQRLKGDEAGLVAYYPFEEEKLDEYSQIVTVGTATDMVTGRHDITALRANEYNVAYSNEAPALKPIDNATNLNYNFVASERGIVIELNEDADRLEGTTVNITVRDVVDLNGNKSLPVTWTALVNRNQLIWFDNNIDVAGRIGEEKKFTATVTNQSAQTEYWMLSDLPSWLSANFTSGSLPALGNQEITFTVDASAPTGKSEYTVYVSGNNAILVPLTVNMNLKADAPEWSVEPADFESSATLFGVVKIALDGEKVVYSEDEDDLVAAFIDGKCVGVTNVQYEDFSDSYRAYLNIYGNSEDAGKEIDLKVWDASTGIVHPVVMTYADVNGNTKTELTYAENTTWGDFDQTYLVYATNYIEQSTPLKKNWNWISVYVNNAIVENYIDDMFSSIGANGITIKDNENFSSYDKAEGWWFGGIEYLNNASMYKVKMEVADTLVMNGVEDRETVVEISNGWNWIPYLRSFTLSLDDAFASAEPVRNDQIKGQEGFAMYNGTAWSGTLKSLTPGKGYLYMSKSSDDKSFNYPTQRNVATAALAPERRNVVERTFAPVDPTEFESNMTMLAVVKDGDEILENAQEIAVFNGAVCLASTTMENDGFFYLTIPGDKTVTSRLTIVAVIDGNIVETSTSFYFVEDAILGDFDAPFAVTVGNATTIGKMLAEGDYCRMQVVDLNGRVYYTGAVADFDENSLNDGQYIFEFFTADGQVVCYKQLIRRIAE